MNDAERDALSSLGSFNVAWLPDEDKYRELKEKPDMVFWGILVRAANYQNKYAVQRMNKVQGREEQSD